MENIYWEPAMNNFPQCTHNTHPIARPQGQGMRCSLYGRCSHYVSIVRATVCSGADQRKHQTPRHWPLWGKPPVTGGFPSQRAINTENVSFRWRHHVPLKLAPSVLYGVNTLRPRKMAAVLQTFSNAFTFPCMKIVVLSFKIQWHYSLGQIKNIPALVWITAWRWSGDKSLPEA